MTVSFNPLKANGQLFAHLPELNDLEFSLSNANAADLLDALGIEDAFAASPWRSPASHWVRPVLVAEIIEHFAVKYRADLACDGPMAAATQALAEHVKAGERIVCLCWCWPKPCHGTLIIDEIKRRLE